VIRIPKQPAELATRPIKQGEISPRVVKWRALLVGKGFVLPKEGSLFGREMQSATLVAQRWAGVTADGLVGPATWKAVARKSRTKRPITVVKTLIGRPKIIDVRRGQFGFARHRTKRWGTRVRGEIVAKLGHYTGGPASFQSDAGFHVNSDYLDQGGAPAIAYTLGIDKDGTIFVFNPWNAITWHCDGGKNTVTLGIVFRGAAEGPTLAQRRSLKWLWKALEQGTLGFDFPPMPVASTTHQHVNSTSCPGVKGEAFYRSISPDFRTHL
jgi:hypothetical protein